MISRSLNKKLSVAKAVVVTGVIVAAVLGVVLGVVRAQTAKPPDPPVQPLPFSHKKHLEQGLKCQGCHTNPDPGKKMTFPPTALCMACHETVAADQPAIKELARFHQSKQAAPWVRIYRNPEWVWFSHRAHLVAAANCARCHGAVAKRDALWKEVSISMESCIKCHRENSASIACNLCHDAH